MIRPHFPGAARVLEAGLLFLTVALLAGHPAAAANVARTDLPRTVIQQMNRVRTDPQGYADFLETCRPYYQGRLLELPGQIPIRTQEGIGALNEAIRVLRRTAPVGPLDDSTALTASAGALAIEQAQTGGVGHFGRDGSTPFSRMARYGTWLDQAAENVDYGARSAERIVADLVIDDGEGDRGHRRNILNQDFHVAGAGFGRHPRFGTVCVIDFAARFVAAR
jgi:uncharacterized protein YkwD